MKNIKVKSTAITRFGRRDSTLADLVAEAAAAALHDIDVDSVAHVFLASYAPGPLCELSDPFRTLTSSVQQAHPRLRAICHGIYKTGGEALFQALETMIAAEEDDGDVLVIGAEKMTHIEPGVAAGILSGRENDHDARYGATLPALGGLVTRAYAARYAIPESALHAVAVKNHHHAVNNPIAHFRSTITAEEVAASPLIADPLRRLHCAPMSDGAAAVLLSRNDGAVTVAGWGRGLDAPLFQDRADETRFRATADAARAAFSMAGITPAEVDVVEIHDAFTSFELINLEEMGFFSPGHAWRALELGDLDVNGELAVNPSGGMKARGHPIGATAMSGTAEIYAQLTKQAHGRQHKGASIGAVQSVGGVSRESYVFAFKGDES